LPILKNLLKRAVPPGLGWDIRIRLPAPLEMPANLKLDALPRKKVCFYFLGFVTK
jgi:hypothetical protein